jgi:rhodanese-related sulfurtransferase
MRYKPPRPTPPVRAMLVLVASVLLAACSSSASPAAPTRPPATPAASAPATSAAPSSAAPAPSAATAPATPAVPLPDTVTVTEASALRDAGAFVLDVREPEEWAQVHIPGAVLIPLDELPGRLAEVPRDRDVVVVCRTGHRSEVGRNILRQAGFARVTSLDGGVTEWQAAGLPTESGA